MKNRICALFLFDGYADWEPALAIANLNKYSDFTIVPFSISGQPVTSMGGIQVVPQKSLSQLQADPIDLLLLPGGDAWEASEVANTALAPLVNKLISQKKVIAAICGATLLLARMGLLNTTPHTSNGLQYLKQHCPTYQGEAFYQQQPCVAAEGIITANGAAMIEFAHSIYHTFQLFDEQMLDDIQALYKSGGMVNRFEEQDASAE